MTRSRLRKTLAYIIVTQGIKYNTVRAARAQLTKDLLRSFNIREDTEISDADLLKACELALRLYRKPNTFVEIRELSGNTPSWIVSYLLRSP